MRNHLLLSILGIILWIGSTNSQELLPEPMGYAEPEAGFAEPESLSYSAEPENHHYMLQKRSLHNHEDEDHNEDPQVEPESSWRRKKRDTHEDEDSDEREEEEEHYLNDGHDHSEDEFELRNKRAVLTKIALYQLGKSLEKQALENGGTEGIPYSLIDDEGDLERAKRTIGKDSKLLNWLLDKKAEKEESFRKYFVKGRYYYKPDDSYNVEYNNHNHFGPEDLEYLNYYATATPRPDKEIIVQQPPQQTEAEEEHHDCHEHPEEEQENVLEDEYAPPPPPPPPVTPPVVPSTDYEPPSENYEAPPPPPPPPVVVETTEEPETVPPPNESYVTPPPGSYEVPLGAADDDSQTPIEVRPLEP